MGGDREAFEKVVAVLPNGWEAKGKELGAFSRGRKIKTAQDLLRLVLLYLTSGKSFGGTAALLNIGAGLKITKKAVFTRIQKCGAWLRWLSENLCRSGGMIAAKPEWLGNHEVYAVDASDEPVYGSTESDYRLHYAVNIFTLCMKEMALTKITIGEKLNNFKKFAAGDIILGDGGYCSLQGFEYIKSTGADYIVRIRAGFCHIYNKQHREVNLLGYFTKLKREESTAVDLYYHVNGQYKPLRICAMRKTKVAERKGLESLRKTVRRKGIGKEPSALQQAYNRYVILATSITDVPAARLLELYRQRWQIELVFKRLKSLFHYNEIPVKVDASAQAWFYGKLLLAAICETWANKGRFSP
jgi:hypothetical protein